MTTKTCSEAEILDSAAKVAAERPGRSYAEVDVTIVSSNVDKRTVTFTASDKNGVKQIFQNIPWNNDDMVIDCPTTLPFEPEQLPAQNAEGTLLLSVELIKGFDFTGTPKFPRSLPAGDQPLLAPLRISPHRIIISPHSILITGEELGDGDRTVATIDLRDPKLAAHNQTLLLDGNPVTLMLTPDGFRAFGRLNFPATLSKSTTP